jgi:hypothetical protein
MHIPASYPAFHPTCINSGAGPSRLTRVSSTEAAPPFRVFCERVGLYGRLTSPVEPFSKVLVSFRPSRSARDGAWRNLLLLAHRLPHHFASFAKGWVSTDASPAQSSPAQYSPHHPERSQGPMHWFFSAPSAVKKSNTPPPSFSRPSTPPLRGRSHRWTRTQSQFSLYPCGR